MFLGRITIGWLTWLIAGISGFFALLIFICCHLMSRHHQKSFDEKYLKESYEYALKESYSIRDEYKSRQHQKEAYSSRVSRPASYAGVIECNRRDQPPPRPPPRSRPPSFDQPSHSKDYASHYASSSMLDDVESGMSSDMKTRSLPAFLRKPRPMSTEDDLQLLYSKVNLSKKYKSRMRSEHAALIALSKSHSEFLDDDADAVIVYDQRTAL